MSLFRSFFMSVCYMIWALIPFTIFSSLAATPFTYNGESLVHDTVIYTASTGIVRTIPQPDGTVLTEEGRTGVVLKGTCVVGGTVTFQNTDPEGSYKMSIEVGGDAVPVTLHAAYNATNPCHLVFDAALGKVIEVIIKDDLLCKGGHNVGDSQTPLFISVRGRGTVRFRLVSERRIVFGNADQEYAETGTHVRILMAQSALEAVEQQRNQLVFERYALESDDLLFHHKDYDAFITFDRYSSLSYLSSNSEGTFYSERFVDTNADGRFDLTDTFGEDGTLLYEADKIVTPGYGSVAFDPSSSGKGGLVLSLEKGSTTVPFSDGGINVFGVYVNPSEKGDDYTPDKITNDALVNNVYFNQRAGIQAFFRIIDDLERFSGLYYTDTSGAYFYNEKINTFDIDPLKAAEWKARTAEARRGLKIINKCATVPHFANNFEQVISIDASKWAVHNSYEPGFIIGINGVVEIEDKRFLDYYAVGTNQVLPPTHSIHEPSVVKKHNPAALYCDGLARFATPSAGQHDRYGNPIQDIVYCGHMAAYGGVHSLITLYGDAGIYARSVLHRTYEELNGTPVRFPYFDLSSATFEEKINSAPFLLGVGRYDGDMVQVLDDHARYRMQSFVASEEGAFLHWDPQHAIDIEGTVTVKAVDKVFYDTTNKAVLTIPAQGVITLPSLEIDHTAQEIKWVVTGEALNPVRATRPLSVEEDAYYAIYNISSILCNADMYLDNVTFFHQDITCPHGRRVLPDTGLYATPSLIGGEFPILTQVGSIGVPLIHLYNSTLALRESLVITGLGISVHQLPLSKGESLSIAHNTSRIIFYERGNLLDEKGYGTMLQLGALNNVCADGKHTYPALTSAYIDIYASEQTPGATEQDPVTIRLEVHEQPEQYAMVTRSALHAIYLAHDSMITLGWPTIEADKGYHPRSFDSTILHSLQLQDFTDRKECRFHPAGISTPTLSFYTTYIALDAGDKEGESPAIPIPGRDIGGVLYVDHAGLLTVEKEKGNCLLNTTIAYRIASDPSVSGKIAIAPDQYQRQRSGNIQGYELDSRQGNVSVNVGPQETLAIDINALKADEDFIPVKS